MNRKIINRIAFKLVICLVAFSSILTITGTAWQLYFDYKGDLGRIVASVNAVTSDWLPEVKQSVLAGDSGSINTLLARLMSSGSLAYAAVIVDEKIAWQQGVKLSGQHVLSSFPLSAKEGEPLFSAWLEVMADTGPVRRQLMDRFIQMLIANGIKIFLVAGFVFLMFQYLVTQHLEVLAKQIRKIDFSEPQPPFKLASKRGGKLYELDQVVSGLNAMQKKAQDAYLALASNEQRLVQFFDSTEEAIIGVDRKGLCTFANDASLGLLQVDKSTEIVGRELCELFVLSDETGASSEGKECIVFTSMTSAKAKQCEDGVLTSPGGRTLFVSLRSYPVFKEGEVSGAIVFMNDNSETRLLRQERHLLSEAVRQAPLIIVIADRDALIQYANPGTERLTGFAREDLLGQSIAHLNSLTRDGQRQLTNIRAKLKKGERWEGVVEIRSRQGNLLNCFSVISPVFDHDRKVVNIIVVAREISYEIALQEELVNVKKMEAVGRLSANFAHEFGNPLFGVRSVLRDVCDRIDFSEEDQALLELAHSECERMRHMVQEFQQLYRDSTGGEALHAVPAIIDATVMQLESLMQKGKVELALAISEDIAEIDYLKNKMSLVLHNIMVNGIESMAPNGGKLTVGARKAGDFLIVSIEDDGRGIPKEQHELVFEPFFSTKPEVEGAGLGLSIAFGTMKDLGGTITFASEEGRGTTFNIYLPLLSR